MIFAVFFINVQCAILFIAWPGQFAPGFELSGPAGEGMIQGLGLLFLMWNVPYAVALSHPVRRRASLYEAIAMQALGFTGESLLLAGFPPGHPTLHAAVARFILFDGAGLVMLLAALACLAFPSLVGKARLLAK